MERMAHETIEPRHLVRTGTIPSSTRRPVAYFCAEFGLHNSVPIYSGGLGVLAGDHCKAASDLGVPLVGVGLFYIKGYFDQRLRLDGWQEDSDDEYDVIAHAARAGQRARGQAVPHHVETFGPPGARARLAHDGGPGADLPARHQPRAEPPGRPRPDEQAVRRRPRPARCGRSGSWASAACACCARWASTRPSGTPTKATPPS